MEQFVERMQDSWNGTFDPSTYEAARRVLEADRERVSREVRGVLARRGRIVGVVAAVWAVCSVALAMANPEWLLLAEIGWTVLVVVAVFYLVPAIMGRGNVDELYAQYAEQLDKLQAARVALPQPADMPDLVAALDLVHVPDQGERPRS